jgi:two-component system chemotaxis response regulator CheY
MPPARPTSVLIVDDSSTIRELTKVFLLWRSFELLEAESAERALSIVGLVPLDLIIADIKLPGMNGIDFVRKLRSDGREKVRNVPVILLTGEKEPKLREQGLSAGANIFLRKPVSVEALNQAIDAIRAAKPS